MLFVGIINLSVSQNIWEPTNGPNGLDARVMKVSKDSVILVSASYSGMFLSNDLGSSWIKRNEGLNSGKSFATSIANSDHGEFWAVIDNSLYYLNKNAASWIKINDDIWENYSIYRSATGTIYLIDRSSLNIWHYSLDGGKTFTRIAINKQWSNIYTFLLNGNGNNYVEVSESDSIRLYRFADDISELKHLYSATWKFRLFSHDTGTIYLHQPARGLYKLDIDSKLSLVDPMSFSKSLYLVVALKPDGRFLAFDYHANYQSDEFGKNWVLRSTVSYPWIGDITQVNILGNEIIVKNTGCEIPQLSKSVDGGNSWVSLDKHFSNPYIEEVRVVTNKDLISSVCDFGRYDFSRDGGASWFELNTPPGKSAQAINLVGTSSGKLIVSTSANLYISADWGNSWDAFNVSGKVDFIKLIGDGNKNVFAIDDSLSYLSNDGGETWKAIATALDGVYGRLQLHKFPNGKFIFFAELRGLFFIYDSVNDEWLLPISGSSFPMAFHVTESGKIYISLETGLYSLDETLEIYQPLSDSSFISIISDIDNNLYALNTKGNCFRSSDGGYTWEPFMEGIPIGRPGTSLAIDGNQHLYMSLADEFVHKTINPVAGPNKVNNQVYDFQIEVSPNLISTKLNVHLKTPHNSKVYYQILDLDGIQKLKGEFHTNNFTIDCSSLNNGMAFIQIFGKDKIYVTKKIVIAH